MTILNKKENLKVMKKSNTLIYIAIILSIFIFIIYNIFNNNINNILNKYINKTDTIYTTKIDTIYSTDTFKIIKPIPKYIEKIKTDTVFDAKGDSIFLKTENKQYIDTLCEQNDTAIIQSYISGINANLDSTKVKLKKQETIITNTVEVTKYINKKKTFKDRIHIGPTITGGYDVINKQWGIMVGGSIGIDLY